MQEDNKASFYFSEAKKSQHSPNSYAYLSNLKEDRILQNIPQTKCCGIILKPGVSIANFFTILLIPFAQVQSLLIATAMVSLIIQDENYYDIPQNHLGDIYGSFATYVSVFTLLSQITSGLLHDWLGRKCVISLSLLLQAVTCAAYPYGKNIYPGLFIIKSIGAISVAWSLTSPLLADYVETSTRGKAGAYFSISNSLGSLIFSFVFLWLAQKYSFGIVLFIEGGLILLVFVYCLIFVKNLFRRKDFLKVKLEYMIKLDRNYTNDQDLEEVNQKNNKMTTDLFSSQIQSSILDNSQQEKNCWYVRLHTLIHQISKNFLKKIKNIFTSLNQSRVLIYIIMCGFVAKINDIMFASFLSIWLSKYQYPDTNLGKKEVAHHLQIILGIGNSIALPLGFTVGFCYDRYKESFVLPLIYLIAGGSNLTLYFLTNFNTPLAYTIQIISTSFGIQTNVIVSLLLFDSDFLPHYLQTNIMIARYAPIQGRGAIYGVFMFAGSLGIMIFSYFGGYIIDTQNNKLIFLITAVICFMPVIAHVFILVCCKSLYGYKKWQNQELQ